MLPHLDPSAFLEIIKQGKDVIDNSPQIAALTSEHWQNNLATIEKGSLLWLGKELPPKVIANLTALATRTRGIFQGFSGSEFSLEDIQEIPFGTAVSILDEAQLVDDYDLQGLWASLLASNIKCANSGDESSRRSFVTILKDLSPLDAVNLRSIYSTELVRKATESEVNGYSGGGIVKPSDSLFLDQTLAFAGISTSYLPDKSLQFDEADRDVIEKAREPLAEQVLVSLSNLARLNLIEPERMIDGGFNYKIVYLTPLGMAFSLAVFLEQK